MSMLWVNVRCGPDRPRRQKSGKALLDGTAVVHRDRADGHVSAAVNSDSIAAASSFYRREPDRRC